VRTVEEFEGAFETMTKERVDAVFVVAASLTGRGRAAPVLLAELAMKHRLPVTEQPRPPNFFWTPVRRI
jgi:hypothetical protein